MQFWIILSLYYHFNITLSIVYHIYIALGAFRAGFLALRAGFLQIFKVYLQNIRCTVLIAGIRKNTTGHITMDHTKSIYLLMEDKAYASGTKQDPQSTLRLACFHRITKTKSYMFCSQIMQLN